MTLPLTVHARLAAADGDTLAEIRRCVLASWLGREGKHHRRPDVYRKDVLDWVDSLTDDDLRELEAALPEAA